EQRRWAGIGLALSISMKTTGYCTSALINLGRLFTLLLWIFSPFPAFAGPLGFYADSFDPPTAAQIRMIRCALGDATASNSCPSGITTISSIMLFVTDDRTKDPLTSTRERILMLNKALQEYGSRVTISAANPAEEKRRMLLPTQTVELNAASEEN